MTSARESTVAESTARYEHVLFIRRFLEKVDVLYRQGHVHGPAHLGLGQEAIAVGAASTLRPDDYTIGTYRGHAHALARGASAEAVLAELLGREGGICAGKGGSMHITSVAHGYYGSYAIVGAHLPIAVGLAWASKIRKSDQVTVCFFGDGAVNIGAFHEAVNLAALWTLPIVFVCENNQYMEYSPISSMIPVDRPAASRASAYGLQPHVVDGNDLSAVRDVVGRGVDRARAGSGPSLIEADTYRLKGHSAADAARYRPVEEVELWQQRDPLRRLFADLVDDGVAETDLNDIDDRIRGSLGALTDRLLAGPRPDPATAFTDVWADGGSRWRN